MLDPVSIIKTAGLIGIFLVIFTESGLFFGFFLPGDTLLFAAGIFASQGFFPISILVIVCSIAAIIGDNVGYWTGKKMGRKLFEREASFFFNKERIYEAEHFYQKHGPITIIIARFIPVIRTFAPIIAGVAHMKYKTFFLFNVLGGIFWAAFIPLIGYHFGSMIPNIEKFLLPIILLVVFLSCMPFILKGLQHYFFRRKR